jgi:ABC-type multidrug transport system ATPase subunit/peptidoglycan/LPS O-acetylase OafA/YrhL
MNSLTMERRERLHSLDAVRAFALLLGVVFHAGFSFLPGMIPGLWAIVDTSPSTEISVLLFTSHIFRMSLFFFIAGFFARMLLQRHGTRGFWIDRGKRIALPLVVGWMVLFPAIATVWVWGLSKTFPDGPPPLPANLPPPPPAAFPLTHLWFLYYLLVIYAIVMTTRAAILTLDRQGRIQRTLDRTVRGLVYSGTAPLALGLPLAVALYVRPNWVMWFGIPTPDQSLLPQSASLIGYGIAMAFGWLTHRQSDLLDVWGRQWHGYLVCAVVATVVCLWIVGLAPSLTTDTARRGLYAIVYVVGIWTWIFAILGLAVRYLSEESAIRRYVADSSYWIYLVHLPVVAAFQVLVGHHPWHWSVKFPLILAASFALLFASYHLLVRFTLIGAVLNGRRVLRRRAAASTEVPANTPASPASDDTCLAELQAVHKRYGKTVALAGLDLQVRRGELVAVLGPNGAGKSTAIGLLLGLIQPEDGAVRLLGRSPLDVESRRSIGVMMQDVALPLTLRVREQVALAASYYPAPLTADEALALTGTQSLAGRRYGALSAGQKRQAQFAIAVCGRPQLLFLDEPTVGLDVQAREAMWGVMRQLVAQGSSIVLTTHYLEEAEALADRVVVLANGRVIATGTVAEIRSIVGRKRVTCVSDLPIDEIRSWDGVVDVVRESHRLLITSTDAESVVRRLLTADAELRELEVRQAGLNEAFTQLTKEAA